MNLESAAETVYNKMPRRVEGNTEFDPTIILVIIQTIMTLIENCKPIQKNPEQLISMAKNPGPLQRLYVKLVVKNLLDTRQNFKEYGDDIMTGLFEAGKSAKADDVKALVKSVVG